MAPVVVGREEPLARLDDFTRGIAEGPRSLVLTGDAGIGKTTLWQVALADAMARGYTVLVSRPAEAETALAYSGLADLLTRVDEAVFSRLPEPQRRALEVALLVSEPEGPPPEPRAIFTALAAVLRMLAGSTPVLVAIDDWQWLDRSSTRALEFTWRRLDDERIGVLATARPGPGVASPGAIGTVTVPLNALSPASLYHLIKAHLGTSLARSTVLRVHRMSAGNPFFALELARVLVAADMPDATDVWPVPDDLREVVVRRIGSLPAPARAALLRAAARGRPNISGLGPAAQRAAEEAGIVTAGTSGGVRFAHPLFASAIYGSAAPAERRREHAALADEEGDIEEQARHRSLACEGTDDAVAALLDRASAKARARGAPDVAAELQERSLALTPEGLGHARSTRLLAAADHRFHTGDLERARALLRTLVADAGHGVPRTRALRLLGEVSYHLGSLGDSLILLRQAVDEAGDDIESLVRAELDLAFVLLHSFGSFEEAGASAGRALAAARRLGHGGLLGMALAGSMHMQLLLGHGLDVAGLEQSLALEDPEQSSPVEMRPSMLAASALLQVGQLDRARALLHALRGQLVDRGAESDLPYVFALLARLECTAGNLVEARLLADQGYELAAQEGSDSLAASARAMRALAEAHGGCADDARAAAADAIELADRSGWRLASFWASTALALLELSRGNDAAVVAILAGSIELIEQHGLAEPSRAPFLPDAIEALVRVGDLDRADRLTKLLEERAHVLDRRLSIVSGARCRALVLAARGDAAGALARLEGVLDEFDDGFPPLERARTLIVRGQLERRCKHKRAARKTLERALELCEEMDARLWAERARAELDRLGRPPDPLGLTATEGRVAALAAAGHTNREIAAAAFMSEKTVEANLSRIYRKLGIRSRAELGVRLAALDAP